MTGASRRHWTTSSSADEAVISADVGQSFKYVQKAEPRSGSMASFSQQAHVGLRVGLTVLWTIVFVAGLTILLLVSFPGLGETIQSAFTSTFASQSISLAVSVALVLLGLWGISSGYRNLRHSVNLIAEVDRARKETIQLESTRYMQQK